MDSNVRKYVVDHTEGVRLIAVAGEKMKQKSQVSEEQKK